MAVKSFSCAEKLVERRRFGHFVVWCAASHLELFSTRQHAPIGTTLSSKTWVLILGRVLPADRFVTAWQ